MIDKVLPTFTTWGGAGRRVRRTRAPWSGTTTKGCRDETRAWREHARARGRKDMSRGHSGRWSPAAGKGESAGRSRSPGMSGSGTQHAWARRACDRSSSVFSRRGSLQEDRSKDGTSFSAGGGDEGRRRFGVGAAASDMCVGKGARWFCRLPLLGAVSVQLPNSGEVSCCV